MHWCLKGDMEQGGLEAGSMLVRPNCLERGPGPVQKHRAGYSCMTASRVGCCEYAGLTGSGDFPSVAPDSTHRSARNQGHGLLALCKAVAVHGSRLPQVKDALCTILATGQHGVAIRLQCAAQHRRLCAPCGILRVPQLSTGCTDTATLTMVQCGALHKTCASFWRHLPAGEPGM